MVERIMEVANQREDSNISKTLAEDVVRVSFRVFQVYIICLLSLWSLSYKMFEVHMDEYLDEETEWVKHALMSSANVGTRRQVCFVILCIIVLTFVS